MKKEYDIYADGWMFLLGGTNSVSDFWIDKKQISEPVKTGWNNLLQSRQAHANKCGYEYLHVVAPEKLSVYPDKCDLIVSDQHIPSNQIENALDDAVKKAVWLNTISYLRKQKEKHLLYSKTDTHWNFLGAFCTYQLVQSRLGRKSNTSVLNRRNDGGWLAMDLGAKLDPPLEEKVFFYRLNDTVSRVYSNEIVEYKENNKRENDIGLHIGSYVVYRNSDPLVDETLMLFGDSFSEYRGHLLTGLFAETYREVHFVWSASFDMDLIEQVKPDIVISELAERFMSGIVPNNNFNHVTYCENKLSAVKAA